MKRFVGMITVGALLFAACSAHSSTAGTKTTAYSDPMVSFAYPAAWQQRRFDVTSSFSHVLTYLSTEPLHDPCIRKTLPGGITSITCPSPIGKLGSDGALVTWSSFGMPGRRLDSMPGNADRFPHTDGRLEITRARTATCDETIDAAFVYEHISSHDQLLQMSACVKGPDVKRVERQVLAMLDSVRVKRR